MTTKMTAADRLKRCQPKKILDSMSPEQAAEFETLYLAYWKYVYKYKVGDPDGWDSDKPWSQREDFDEQLEEEGMIIKVREGY